MVTQNKEPVMKLHTFILWLSGQGFDLAYEKKDKKWKADYGIDLCVLNSWGMMWEMWFFGCLFILSSYSLHPRGCALALEVNPELFIKLHLSDQAVTACWDVSCPFFGGKNKCSLASFHAFFSWTLQMIHLESVLVKDVLMQSRISHTLPAKPERSGLNL